MKASALALVVLAALPAFAVTPITSCPYVISAPGNYVLANDLDCPSGSYGIWIQVSNVTLQFNGHKLSVEAPGGTNAIELEPSSRLDHVGIVGPGLIVGTSSAPWIFGINAFSADYLQVSQMTIASPGQSGIQVVSNYATIAANQVSQMAIGITVAGSSNTVSGNDTSGNASIGIQDAGTGTTIQGNTANGNARDGIDSVGTGGRVTGNVANGNGRYGIFAEPSNQIFSNSSVRANGTSDLFDPIACGSVWSNNVFFTANAGCIH